MTRDIPKPNHFWDDNTYVAGGRTTQFRHTAGRNIDFATWQAVSDFDVTSTYQVTGTEKPTGTKVFVRPNRYEAGRAQVVVYNWDGQASVPVDVSAILQPGERYELYDAQNYFAGPILSGVFANTALQVPMSDLTAVAPRGTGMPTPPHTAPEFAVFIVRTVFEREDALPARLAPFPTETSSDLPTSKITASSSSGDAPLYVFFDASGSFSSDGSPLPSYHWDFGDGQTSDNAQAEHTFFDVGNYLVTLAITDDHGMVDSAWFSIDVTNQNQTTYLVSVINGSGSDRYTAGTSVTITANAPPQGQVFSQWIGDVATVANVHSDATSLTVPSADISVTATYTPGQTVDDGRGGSDSAPFNIIVTDSQGIEITLDNEDSDVTYTGHWGSGSRLSGKYGPNYRYIASGIGGKATFDPIISTPGHYEIRINYPAHSNRASDVNVRVNHTGGTETFTVNMQTGGTFELLGTGAYPLDDTSTVEIQQNANDYVGADAVRFTLINTVTN
jgi:hypothetical protein